MDKPQASSETQNEHPLLASRPPVTDAITYLTIVEYNLSEENLPILHNVLQDPELTATIGWDLIHLLLPLLPASEECLQDIATRGNPRECVLKVTEALRILDFEDPQEETDEEEHVDEGSGHTTLKVPDIGLGESSTSPALQKTILPPLPVLKFEVLLHVLATLHRRIKTKYPSRFLSTSLQAVLLAYNRAKTNIEELTLSTIKFVKTMSGPKRPHLPSRRSSGSIFRSGSPSSAPDPEAQGDEPSKEELQLVNRLCQSFLTHILEDYVLSLSSDDDVPGLAWSNRLMEQYQPARIPKKPNYQKYGDRFASDEDLISRVAIVGQILALTQDLGLKYQGLLQTAMDPEIERRGIPGTEDEPPATAEDIPLSRTGSLLLIAARTVRQELYASPVPDEQAAISIFPGHATILSNFVGMLGPQTIGLEPEPLLDTILAIGLITVEKNNIGEPKDDEAFAQYLQALSLISANTPSASLRGHAHFLTSTVLRTHPHDLVRLSFIRDTLEHCPYDNLKASAVSWLKGETLEAATELHTPHTNNSISTSTSTQDDNEDHQEEQINIFATPVALSTVSPFLWPDLSSTYDASWLTPENLPETFLTFRRQQSFYLASLNFYLLLLRAKNLAEMLGVKDHSLEHFLNPLKEAMGAFKKELEKEGETSLVEGGDKEGREQARADVGLVESVVGWVEGGAR